MTGNELCPFNNANCMCQFCTEPCNNGLNCWECKSKGEQVHSVYLCTGFKGDLNRYLENWKAHQTEGENEPEKREPIPLAGVAQGAKDEAGGGEAGRGGAGTGAVQGLPQPGNHGLLRRVQKGLFGDREAG